MNEPDFSDCIVRFDLEDGDSFSIRPRVYLKFNDSDEITSRLLSATLELNTRGVSRQAGDHIYLKSFAALRDYLSGIQTAKTGEVLEFRSEEGVAAITFTRQETTVRIFGRIPSDGYFEDMHSSDCQSRLEKCFATQIIFYCNFPLKSVSATVDAMTKILRATEDSK